MTQLNSKQRTANRLEAVCDAYFAHSEEDDFGRVHDALYEAVFQDFETGPTFEQIKVFVKLLPENIVGKAISWGFSDTEVGDEVFEFARDNKELVLEKLGLTVASLNKR